MFFIQVGFAMLCAGSIQLKNVQIITFKNILDACGALIGFWAFGCAFAYSPDFGGDGISFIERETLLHEL